MVFPDLHEREDATPGEREGFVAGMSSLRNGNACGPLVDKVLPDECRAAPAPPKSLLRLCLLLTIGVALLLAMMSCSGTSTNPPSVHALLDGPGGDVDFLSTSTTLIVASDTGSVEMRQWDALDKPAESKAIAQALVAVCPNDRVCLIIPYSGGHSPLVLWDMKEGKELKRWEIEREWYLGYLRPSRNGRYVVVGLNEELNVTKNFDGAAIRFGVFDAQTMRLTWLKTRVGAKYGSLGAISISDDGAYLAIVGRPTAPSITVIDVRADTIAWQKEPEDEAGLDDVRFSPDGPTVYAGGTMSWVYAFDVRTGKLLKKWSADPTGEPRFGYRVCSLAVSNDGRLVAAGTGPNGDVLIWDVVAGKRLAFFESDAGTAYNLIFSPDASYLASRGTKTAQITIWKVPAPEAQ